MRWFVLLGLLAFAGIVVYTSVSPAQTQCEVCLEFNGEQVCRRGAGENEETAIRAAQESACGGNVSGMSEIIACRAQEPVSSRCDLE